MIVADASIIVESLLAAGPTGRLIRSRIAGADVHSPHLVDIEVAAALRRLVTTGGLTIHYAQLALLQLPSMAVTRHSHRQFLVRIWELRENISAYDAAYVAIAERANATLLTLDRRLANAPGPRCRIEVMGD